MTIANDFKSGIHQIIAQLGMLATYTDNAGANHNVRVAITQIPKDAGELVNALGIEGSIGYIEKPAFVPTKFDVIQLSTGKLYTVFVVSDINVNDALVGYKLGLKS